MNEILDEEDRQKRDTRPDEHFYGDPRFVTHADAGFIDRLEECYRSVFTPGDRVFDMMSSWVSHLPDVPLTTVVGHDLNEAELRENDALDDWFVQDLNTNQTLPLAADSFDRALCALSVQYLQYPAAVFAELERVLTTDGTVVVSFSNRMFPTKAIRAWRQASMDERLELVAEYMRAGGLEPRATYAEQPAQDPFYAVVGQHT
jgi:SAM-dependent methyltransferase